ELDGFVVFRDRGVVVAPGGVDEPAVVIGPGKFRIELDRLAIVGQGALLVVLVGVCDAAAVIGDGPVRRAFAGVVDHAGAGGNLRVGRAVGLALLAVVVAGGKGRQRDQHADGASKQMLHGSSHVGLVGGRQTAAGGAKTAESFSKTCAGAWIPRA